MRWFVLLTFTLLSACIYLPIIEYEPYKEVSFDSIELGKSTRADIVELLGEPAISRQEDSIWMYGESRHVGHIIARAGSGWFGDYQFLVFEFNQDYVKSFELIEEKNGCSSNGICLPLWLHPYSGAGSQSLIHDLAVVASVRDDDRNAKKFQSVPEKCALYIYQNYHQGRVAVGSIRNVLIAKKAYLHLLLSPGSQLITALQNNDRGKGVIVSKEVECQRGDVLFVRIAEKPWSWGRKPAITVVDSNVGREAISTRKLILLP